MEINYRTNDDNIKININNSKIIGIICDNEDNIIDLLKGKEENCEIIVNDNIIKNKELNKYRNKTCVINEYEHIGYINNVLEFMNNYIIKKNLMIKNPNKKIIESLHIVGLNEDYLLRNINSLSSSEKELLNIGVNLLSNPDIIILRNQFKYLDLNNRKKMYRLLLKLKDQYNKTIIIMTNNLNYINNYCNKCIFINKDKTILDLDTRDFFSNKANIIRSGYEIPEIIKLTYLVKEKKNIKLEYHKDVRDMIKDIYKHV